MRTLPDASIGDVVFVCVPDCRASEEGVVSERLREQAALCQRETRVRGVRVGGQRCFENVREASLSFGACVMGVRPRGQPAERGDEEIA